jgi:hypothetical protein
VAVCFLAEPVDLFQDEDISSSVSQPDSDGQSNESGANNGNINLG